jgi:hypothetical protein
VTGLNNATIVIPLTKTGPNTYTFTMPAHHVNVAAVFQYVGTNIVGANNYSPLQVGCPKVSSISYSRNAYLCPVHPLTNKYLCESLRKKNWKKEI